MSEARKQLEVFHDPFSAATSQPKIPDGKCNSSLGISLQAVGEIQNLEDSTVLTSATNIMHLVFYAGQNGCMTAFNCEETGGQGDYNCFGFDDGGGVNWSTLTSTGGPVHQVTPYGQWRTVSAGLRLSLLNAVEEDDGWFEAVRLNYPMNAIDFRLSTLNRSNDPVTKGHIHPLYPISDGSFPTRTLSNEPSYVTGLMRDLEKFQFELHGKMDHHDFVQGKEMIYIDGGAVGTSVPFISPYTANLSFSTSETADMINQYIDPGYDMIYVRLHCRENLSTSSTLNGSRLHYNFVSNQEVVYRGDTRDSRYQTQSQNIGVSAAARHGTLRRVTGAAALEM